jgi:hypothetical protein
MAEKIFNLDDPKWDRVTNEDRADTIDGNEVQVHYALGGAQPEMLKYGVDAPADGKYELTAEVCTVTMDREFMLRLDRRTLVNIALPYPRLAAFSFRTGLARRKKRESIHSELG